MSEKKEDLDTSDKFYNGLYTNKEIFDRMS